MICISQDKTGFFGKNDARISYTNISGIASWMQWFWEMEFSWCGTFSETENASKECKDCYGLKLYDNYCALFFICIFFLFYKAKSQTWSRLNKPFTKCVIYVCSINNGSITGLLFHRGVLMSGSALSPWALVRGAANYAMQVAKHLNCSLVSTCKHVHPIDGIIQRVSL